jgi:hypothetical protein
MTEQQAAGGGFTRHIAKKALAPIVASAATAITAYLMRKAAEVWEQQLQPKLEERGGGKAVATETLENVRERLPDSASEKLDELSSKVSSEGGEDSSEAPAAAADDDRAKERRKREQRRRQRRKALDQAGSS